MKLRVSHVFKDSSHVPRPVHYLFFPKRKTKQNKKSVWYEKIIEKILVYVLDESDNFKTNRLIHEGNI